MLQSNSVSAYQSTRVPMATIYSSGSGTRPANTNDGAVVVENSGIFRSHTARIIAILTAIALLTTSLISANNNRGSNLKDLSDTVMDLTKELKRLEEENKKKEKDLGAIEKELEEKKIELAWESQHVQDAAKGQEMMYDTMKKEVKNREDVIIKATKETSTYARASYDAQNKLHVEHDENAKLKVALSQALEDLAMARMKLPPAPGAEAKAKDSSIDVNKGPPDHDKALKKKVKERMLRGVNPWQPGDNVEIIEYEKSEPEVASLRPGIITEFNTDGTYNIVKLEESIVKNHVSVSMFQTYHVYPPGTAAMFEVSRNIYFPITIVRFVEDSARLGFELHGKYEYTLDSDTSGKVKVTPAMRIHRLAPAAEVTANQKDFLEHYLK